MVLLGAGYRLGQLIQLYINSLEINQYYGASNHVTHKNAKSNLLIYWVTSSVILCLAEFAGIEPASMPIVWLNVF